MDKLEARQIQSAFLSEKSPEASEIVGALATGLNAKIDAFHDTTDMREKRKILYDIYQIQQHADDDISSRLIAKNKPFRDFFHHTLFYELQSEFQKLGVPSLEKNDLEASMERPNHFSEEEQSAPLSLTQIIANLSPEKINSLAAGLSRGLQGPQLRDFLSRHDVFDETVHALSRFSFEFLGGANSKIYKVSDGTTDYILKIEDRFGRVRTAVETLMASETSQKHFVERYESRQATYRPSLNRATVCNTLSIEENCPGGNVSTLFEKLHTLRKLPEASANLLHLILDNALDLCTKTGDILIDIHKEDAFFTDVKPSNLLLKKEGDTMSVVIADTKSIISSPNGKYSVSPSSALICTLPFKPPEFHIAGFNTSNSEIDVDKTHAFFLGKILYLALTGCEPEELCFIRTGDGPNDFKLESYTQDALSEQLQTAPIQAVLFREPIFNTNRGIKLQNLILDLIQETPEKRPTVQEAVERLKLLPIQHRAEQSLAREYARRLKGSRLHKALPGYVSPLYETTSIESVETEKTSALDKITALHEAYKSDLLEKIEEIETYKLDEKDSAMDRFISTWRDKIESFPAPTFGDTKKLETVLSALKENRQHLSTLSEDEKKSWKATQLELPVKDRVKQRITSNKDYKKELSDIKEQEETKPTYVKHRLL